MDAFFDFLQVVIDIVESFFTATKKKTKDTKDIFELKSEIKTCEGLINRSYASIGRKYYEAHKDDENQTYEKEMKEIKNASDAIVELKAQIEDIKNS